MRKIVFILFWIRWNSYHDLSPNTRKDFEEIKGVLGLFLLGVGFRGMIII